VDTVLVDKLFSGGEDFSCHEAASFMTGRTIVLPGQALILQSFDKRREDISTLLKQSVTLIVFSTE
jgi:hypothetical protein